MTVAQLIEALQQLPQNLKVCFSQDNWDADVRAARLVTEYQHPHAGEKTTYVLLGEDPNP